MTAKRYRINPARVPAARHVIAVGAVLSLLVGLATCSGGGGDQTVTGPGGSDLELRMKRLPAGRSAAQQALDPLCEPHAGCSENQPCDGETDKAAMEILASEAGGAPVTMFFGTFQSPLTVRLPTGTTAICVIVYNCECVESWFGTSSLSLDGRATEVTIEMRDLLDGCVSEEIVFVDSDGDGWGGKEIPLCEAEAEGLPYVQAGGDCDDEDPYVNPDAVEVCDGIDNDCDGSVDEDVGYFPDNDFDGFGDENAQPSCESVTGYVMDNTDCDDTDPYINPDATEDVCNNVDDNCNGEVDEGPGGC